MRKRSLITIVLAAGLTLAASFCSFAGEWKADTTGWSYQNTDGSYLSNGWYWIDGRSYYFNGQGYCLTSTTTPDGYTVDESGAWTENGQVKTKATEETMQGIRVVIPNGYDCERNEENGSLELSEVNGSNTGILAMCFEEEDIEIIRTYMGDDVLKYVSDILVQEVVDSLSVNVTFVSTSSKTYSSGTWNYYAYSVSDSNGQMVPIEFYTNFTGQYMRLVAIFRAAGREFVSNDQFMENCIR